MKIFTKLLHWIDHLVAVITIKLIQCYQKTLSPDQGIFSPVLKGKVCSHHPHCSLYATQCLQRYGFFQSIKKITNRVLHCTSKPMTIYDPSHYRVVFFSGAPIGVPFLQELAQDKRFEIVGIVTQPDKPVGRGLQMQENIIKKTASALPIFSKEGNPDYIQTPATLKDPSFQQWLETKSADFFIVIAYGKLLPQSILDMPTLGAINVHGSLLPKYRGASPLQSVFLQKEKQSGLTIMKMDAGMDTGEIIDQLSFPLQFHRTVKELIQAFTKVGPKFLTTTLRDLAKRKLTPEKQDESKVIMTKKIEKADGFFVLSLDNLESIYTKYRAFFLRPKPRFIWQDKRIVIEELLLDEALFEIHKNGLLAENGKLNPAVKEIVVKPEGKKAMDWKSFVNGYLK